MTDRSDLASAARSFPTIENYHAGRGLVDFLQPTGRNRIVARADNCYHRSNRNLGYARQTLSRSIDRKSIGNVVSPSSVNSANARPKTGANLKP